MCKKSVTVAVWLSLLVFSYGCTLPSSLVTPEMTHKSVTGAGIGEVEVYLITAQVTATTGNPGAYTRYLKSALAQDVRLEVCDASQKSLAYPTDEISIEGFLRCLKGISDSGKRGVLIAVPDLPLEITTNTGITNKPCPFYHEFTQYMELGKVLQVTNDMAIFDDDYIIISVGERFTDAPIGFGGISIPSCSPNVIGVAGSRDGFLSPKSRISEITTLAASDKAGELAPGRTYPLAEDGVGWAVLRTTVIASQILAVKRLNVHELRDELFVRGKPLKDFAWVSDLGDIYTLTTQTPVAGVGLLKFDSNASCKLEDEEFFEVLDAYASGNMEEDLFMRAVDAWIEESNICSSNICSGE
jgi:hypothetical protein